METIDLPPFAPSLIESTRAIGYSLEAAIADIIDNSIAANATQIDVSFFPLDGAYISILDNGNGMDSNEITQSMQYGSQNPLETRNEYDLGRFGLGLKTASLSQCRKLTVVSKKDGVLQARQWDIDHVIEARTWSLIVFNEEDELSKIPNIEMLRQLDSGTLVVWQNLDRMRAGTIDFAKSMGRQFDAVREHISLVFHRYISGEQGLNKITIKINNTDVSATDPFLIGKSDPTMQEETIKVQNAFIKVQPFILPHMDKMTNEEIKSLGGKDGLRKLQGFYVYRNKRLLVWGTWFRMMRKGELSKLARIRVDIPNSLDELWTLDIKKSTATPPEEVLENLAKLIDKIGGKSKLKFTRRGKKETDDSYVHLWNRMKSRGGGYYYEINKEHPLVNSVSSDLGENNKALFSLLEQIEKTLPLNQLYIDLTNDEHIENDKKQNDADIKSALSSMLPTGVDASAKIAFLQNVKGIPPYNEHSNVIEQMIREVSS